MVDAYEAWICGGCGNVYDTKQEAESCCVPDLGEEDVEPEDESAEDAKPKEY